MQVSSIAALRVLRDELIKEREGDFEGRNSSNPALTNMCLAVIIEILLDHDGDKAGPLAA
jgi:hypothetical protein